MPVYVCSPGSEAEEPWRHGIQVYQHPVDIDSITNSGPNPYDRATGTDTENAAASGKQDENSPGTETTSQDNSGVPDRISRFQPQGFVSMGAGATTAGGTRSSILTNNTASNPAGVRRVRHAEIVLVDDVCIAHGRYWLRLRWPGHKGGFAGYIAMGLVSENNDDDEGDQNKSSANILSNNEDHNEQHLSGNESGEEREDIEREETGSMPPSEPDEEVTGRIMCRRTGLAFQSSNVLKLLAVYDDGVVPCTALPPFPTEQVFCRICREGLHDDADQEQPAPEGEMGGEGGDNTPRIGGNREHLRDNNDDDEPPTADPVVTLTKGPVQPHPHYHPNTDALQNPMLAPCECSGSMAFVHYLCVEQWRCRSRHPDAANGLNCETCNTPYSLPPPSERPVVPPVMDQEDWLDAMPPHVMQALRQPHICWQIGAAIVRRRWLRPVAPVIMSPIVALYCRSRRLLKKRGVARRRWACSLCRRRARWKCVRCLRSYYCSRQCQNVSWHIIHKHVCYKPVRFWWSVVVYGCLTIALFPGILRDPLMYDLGVCLIPASFVIMGILGGGIATVLKKTAGVDLRGRLMELSVVVWTLWFSVMSWGLVKGFFGDSSACYGTVGSYNVSSDDMSSTYVLRGLRAILLQPAEKIYLTWDRMFLKSGSLIRAALCTKSETPGCFEHLPNANANFILAESNGQKCAADLMLFFALYVAAGVTFAGSALYKHHERRRRRQHGRRGRPHLHQD